MSVGTVLDDPQVVFLGDGENGIHIDGKTCHMNWNDGFGTRSDGFLNESLLRERRMKRRGDGRKQREIRLN